MTEHPVSSAALRAGVLTIFIVALRHSGAIRSFATLVARLKTHWVMVVMDQFTRRIIGLAVNPA